MTTLQLSKTRPSATTATSTPLVPTIAEYGPWYSCGYADWTCAEGDIITVTQWVVYEITDVVSSGTEQLAIYARSRLIDQTSGYEVPAGTKTTQVFRTIGAKTYGPLTAVQTYNETLIAGARGLLIPGRLYRLSLDIRKEQAVGMPTATVTIADSTAFSSAASVLL